MELVSAGFRKAMHPSMRGVDIFDFYCAPCHGRDLRGGGPTAAALSTRYRRMAPKKIIPIIAITPSAS